jgi:hypothetical protein
MNTRDTALTLAEALLRVQTLHAGGRRPFGETVPFVRST